MNSRLLLYYFSVHCIVLLSSFTLAACVINGNLTDRLALLDFKAKITDDPLGFMPLWNDSTHFCQWYGVTCSRRHQRVAILNLRSLQLAGSISPHIGNLSFLRDLYLQNNSFSHGIPPEVGRLRRLQRLRLSNNSLTGNIPSNISACSKLSEIYFAYNQLEGEIPEELSLLAKLQVISIQKNYFSGSIPPSIGNLSSLQVLSAPENYLSGNIPDAIGQLNNLIFISLSVNNLSGTIPPSIYNLSSINTLNIVYNQIQGRLPSNLGITLPNLQVFAIARNDFIGSIPSSFSNASNLVWLIMSENKLTGRVPSLEQLHNLQILGLGYNYLGLEANDLDFVSSLVNCTNLWRLEIHNNKFHGVLPESISNFSTTFSQLVIAENNISGRIPSSISNLVNLERLEMANNQLSGNIPSNFGNLNMLKVLHLFGNKLSGTIPSSLGNLTMLLTLSFYDNNLQGRIPSSLAECENLMVLDLAKNNLSGSIPLQVFGLSSLSIALDLSANHFTGVIPMEVGNLKDLEQLGISDNMLSGRIPDSLGSCIKLEVLALQGNFFDGLVPSSLSSLRGLRVLDFSSNNLSGEIPEFLQSFDLLESLNLSYNNFEGRVPVEGIFRNASTTLVMGNDKLCGGIPEFHLAKCNAKSPKKLTLLLKIVISTICSLLGLSFILIFALTFWLRKKKEEPTSDPYGHLLLNVSFQSLLRATDGFSSANLIGRGSFGHVYKGFLDEGNVTIAVKVLNLLHHGASTSFIAECEALRNIRHRNLVKVLTACSGIDYQGNDFKALVYEYMVNGSLEEWLHPIPRTEEVEPPRSLNLLQRLNIAIDVASALDYLHNQCTTPIVHCDLKPSNVLLDSEMNGHVSDFGLAKILSESTNSFPVSQSSSIGVRGTVGFAPPEYGVGSNVSTYGDVYSYGILLLELFTGKRPTDDMFKEDLNLHNFAEIAFRDQLAEVADPILLQETAVRETRLNSRKCQRLEECLFSMLRIGVACSTEMPQERMKINDVVTGLHAIRDKLVRIRRH
ncbi:probable LRR receptor-like serine/threonine-protein kinase At3g47570 isoform X1 [Ricinus communis]|uniref:probable LRR receptor-like serine/threonine-protein kinase At3g47570 isoform X1 n=1 Tax=Ricinus communis TaxID=3988 RepID=UPI00201B250B|nr:probable LRR receptor-like serine/threonine-protein kinase At3g47570 isoform X1 [Ricinus communis]